MRKLLLCSFAVCLASCTELKDASNSAQIPAPNFEIIGSITTSQTQLIDPAAKIEKLGGDYGWSEGPVWVNKLGAVLFTDVPGNTIWKYKDGEGLTKYTEAEPFGVIT